MTLVSACVCCLFYIGACFVNLGMALGSIASFVVYKCYCWRRVCRFHFKMLVLVVSIFVFGVVGVVVVAMPGQSLCTGG